MRHYRAYGLRIASELACPDLLEADGEKASGENADITVHWGPTPTELDAATSSGVLFQANATQFLLRLPRAGRYWIRDGCQVVIERNPEASDELVRVFLLTAGMGALLHQRGSLPLHGSAIATPRGAVLFLGGSGVGKSTLAGAFQRCSYALLADDICAITSGPQGCWLQPAYPQLGLWADSAEKLALPANQLTRMRPQIQKYVVIPQHFSAEPLPVAAIYLLNAYADAPITLTPVRGFRKIAGLNRHIYRKRYLQGLSGCQKHMLDLQTLAQQTRLVEVQRPEKPFLLDDLMAAIEQDFQRG